MKRLLRLPSVFALPKHVRWLTEGEVAQSLPGQFSPTPTTWKEVTAFLYPSLPTLHDPKVGSGGRNVLKEALGEAHLGNLLPTVDSMLECQYYLYRFSYPCNSKAHERVDELLASNSSQITEVHVGDVCRYILEPSVGILKMDTTARRISTYWGPVLLWRRWFVERLCALLHPPSDEDVSFSLDSLILLARVQRAGQAGAFPFPLTNSTKKGNKEEKLVTSAEMKRLNHAMVQRAVAHMKVEQAGEADDAVGNVLQHVGPFDTDGRLRKELTALWERKPLPPNDVLRVVMAANNGGVVLRDPMREVDLTAPLMRSLVEQPPTVEEMAPLLTYVTTLRLNCSPINQPWACIVNESKGSGCIALCTVAETLVLAKELNMEQLRDAVIDAAKRRCAALPFARPCDAADRKQTAVAVEGASRASYADATTMEDITAAASLIRCFAVLQRRDDAMGLLQALDVHLTEHPLAEEAGDAEVVIATRLLHGLTLLDHFPPAMTEWAVRMAVLMRNVLSLEGIATVVHAASNTPSLVGDRSVFDLLCKRVIRGTKFRRVGSLNTLSSFFSAEEEGNEVRLPASAVAMLLRGLAVAGFVPPKSLVDHLGEQVAHFTEEYPMRDCVALARSVQLLDLIKTPLGATLLKSIGLAIPRMTVGEIVLTAELYASHQWRDIGTLQAICQRVSELGVSFDIASLAVVCRSLGKLGFRRLFSRLGVEEVADAIGTRLPVHVTTAPDSLLSDIATIALFYETQEPRDAFLKATMRTNLASNHSLMRRMTHEALVNFVACSGDVIGAARSALVREFNRRDPAEWVDPFATTAALLAVISDATVGDGEYLTFVTKLCASREGGAQRMAASEVATVLRALCSIPAKGTSKDVKRHAKPTRPTPHVLFRLISKRCGELSEGMVVDEVLSVMLAYRLNEVRDDRVLKLLFAKIGRNARTVCGSSSQREQVLAAIEYFGPQWATSFLTALKDYLERAAKSGAPPKA